MDERGEKQRNGCAKNYLSSDNAKVDVSAPIDYHIDEHNRNEVCRPTEKSEEHITQQVAKVAHRAVDSRQEEASNDEDDAKLEELATQLSEWVERLTADDALLVWLTVETWFNDRGDSLFDNLEDYYEEEEDLYW